jgi:diaminopimelate decarboxylase
MKLTEQHNKVYIRDFSFEDIAAQYGTPFYLYDLDTIKEKIHNVRNAFGDSIEILYAVKANPNRELLRGIRMDVDGLDIASKGEMEQALFAGYEAKKLSFAGPGKNRAELSEAMKYGIGIISVESLRELNDIKTIAIEERMIANIALRINPQLLIKEFAIKMGGKATQFGIDEEDVESAISFMRQHEDSFNFLGVHIYAGTQCMSEEAIAKNIENTLEIAARLKSKHGLECSMINLGGGFGVSYYGEDKKLDLKLLAKLVKPLFANYRSSTGTNPRLIFELGRYLVADAGIYVTRVISEKKSRGEQFYILDGGMNHHLAASGNLGSMIRKNYAVRNLSNPVAPKELCNLVGPLCTPIDLMGKGVSIESPRLGDLIGFLNSGSYGFTASPLLFLGHETPVELLIQNGNVTLTRNRKTIVDFN